MIIIALPKSASTSLMWSIARALNIGYQNGISRKGEIESQKCKGFPEIQKFYGTTIKRDFEYLKKWITRKDIIYKEHLLPTAEHIEYVKQINKPVIILTRDSLESIDNHLRMKVLHEKNKLNKREQKGLIIKKMVTLDFNKLKTDFDNFSEGWLSLKLENALYITFNELILNPKGTLKKVLNHLGFRVKHLRLELLKAKGNRGDYNTYTGVGEKRLRERNACNCTAKER